MRQGDEERRVCSLVESQCLVSGYEARIVVIRDKTVALFSE
jgi:hypothetical protein